MSKPLVIGVTGKMGSGKTTLAQRLIREGLNARLISVDVIRRTLCPDTRDCQQQWRENGGAIIQAITRQINECGAAFALLEWPRLTEDGFADMLDGVLIVDTAEDELRKRFIDSDLPASELHRRWALQQSSTTIKAELAARAIPHLVVRGDGNVDSGKIHNFLTTVRKTDSSICLFRIPHQGKRVIWEVTNTCNYGCRYCIFSSTARKHADELSTAQALSVIDQLAMAGFTHVKFTGGEPFSRPDMMELLEHTHQRGLVFDISTNASLITPELAARLTAAKPDKVHVSLDGYSREQQEAVRGKRTYQPTLDGLKLLTAAGLPVRIGCVVYKNNQHNLGELVELCHVLGCEEVIFSLMEPVGRMRGKTDLLCSRPLDELQAEINRLQESYANRIKLSSSFARTVKAGRGRCPGGEQFISIDHKGRVSPCTWVAEYRPAYISAKTLHDTSLCDILDGPEISQFRALSHDMTRAGLAHCPMRQLETFTEIEEISALFSGSPEEHLMAGGNFSRLSALYAFSTENLTASLTGLPVGKSCVLTIGGSGDQMISALMAGATSVENVDINLLAHYWAELKLAALAALSRHEFLGFIATLERDVYEKLAPCLSLPARYFFDRAYSYYRDGAVFRRSPFFRAQQDDARLLRNIPYLANDRAYLGCGTGKYLELLAPVARHITGLEAAPSQLAIARQRTDSLENVRLLQGDACSFDYGAQTFDVIIACWVLGTILDPVRRLQAITSAFCQLRTDGTFILVENSSHGAFEELRGKVAASSAYNSWLVGTGRFSHAQDIRTHFQFQDAQTAQRVFSAIWGEQVGAQIDQPIIAHHISLFRKVREASEQPCSQSLNRKEETHE